MKIIVNKQTEEKKLDKMKIYDLGIKISEHHYDFMYIYEEYYCKIVPLDYHKIKVECSWRDSIKFDLIMTPKPTGEVEIELGEVRTTLMLSTFDNLLADTIREITSNIVNSFDFIFDEITKTKDRKMTDVFSETMNFVEKCYKEHNLEELYSSEEKEKAWIEVSKGKHCFNFFFDNEACMVDFTNEGYFMFVYYSTEFSGRQLYNFDGECLFVDCKKEDLLMQKATELNSMLTRFMTTVNHMQKNNQKSQLTQISMLL